MRWLKHMTSTWDDEKISAVVDELGLEGYGFWWRILEIIATQLDENSNTSCEYSAKKWGSFFNFSAKKFEKFAKIFQKSGILQADFFENSIRISIPNILKYRDEWTKKKAKNSGVNPEELRRKETETESDTEEDIKTPPISPASGGQEGAKENSSCIADENSKPAPGSRGDGTNPRAQGSDLRSANANPRALGTNPRAVQEQGDFAECSEQEPPIEFQELRRFYDAEMRPEGPMAGWKEFKQAKSGGYWPGVSRIVQDIEERKKACVWNPGYEIGLGRYLAERTWLGEIKARASPEKTGQPTAKTEFQKNMQDRRLMATALMQHRKQEKENHGKCATGKRNSAIVGNVCLGLPDQPNP